MILEMLGITIPLPSLPSWDEYQRLHQRLYGNDRRILLLKRTFTPRRYKRLWKRYIEVQLNLQQEFLDAALNESAEVGIDE